jgi:hypothetical protein
MEEKKKKKKDTWAREGHPTQANLPALMQTHFSPLACIKITP